MGRKGRVRAWIASTTGIITTTAYARGAAARVCVGIGEGEGCEIVRACLIIPSSIAGEPLAFFLRNSKKVLHVCASVCQPHNQHNDLVTTSSSSRTS